MSQHWVLASNNKGKLKEFADLLADVKVDITPQAEFGVVDAVEDGLSFIENAIIKARWAAKHTGLPALADDSGLAVDALGGAPGIYSARYAGEGASDQDNIDKLLEAMKDVAPEHRSGQFHCVLAFVRHELDPTPVICHGQWHGFVTEAQSGENGFGYDPIFKVPDLNITSAELSKEEKAKLSHRGQAIALFKQALPDLLA